MTRDVSFYDLIAHGLGDANYQEFVDTLLKDKYSAMGVDGFTAEPYLQLDFSYDQIEANLGLYTMPTYVDIDSPAPYKSTEGFTIGHGEIPRFKHGFMITEKILREEAIIAQKTGRFSASMKSAMQELLFNSTDQLLGGNQNAMTYQRDQMVSTGKFVLSLDNNPEGLTGLTFDAHVPAGNKTALAGTKRWYIVAENGAVTYGSASDPIKDLLDLVKKAKKAGIGKCHFEVDSASFEDAISTPKMLQAIGYAYNPMAASDAIAQSQGANLDIAAQTAVLARKIGAGIVPIDHQVEVEKKDKATKSVVKTQINTFAADTWVLVPDGALGTIKAVQPLYPASPSIRWASFDGGATVLKQTFNDETNVQYIQSESTRLVVPNKPKHMYYLNVTAAS